MSKVKKEGVLTARQELFVREYATVVDGQRAAINAGYAKGSAAVTGCKLLKNPLIVAGINKLQAKSAKKMDFTREKVLAELAKGLFRDPIGLEDANGFLVSRLKDIPPELRTIIDSFEVIQDLDKEGNPYSQKIKVKLVSKASVIDMGMKHLGAYAAEKTDNTHKLNLDWDELYGRSKITDPAIEAIKQIGVE
jgi:hypothetical protein